jgi:hypothetical protein
MLPQGAVGPANAGRTSHSRTLLWARLTPGEHAGTPVLPGALWAWAPALLGRALHPAPDPTLQEMLVATCALVLDACAPGTLWVRRVSAGERII